MIIAKDEELGIGRVLQRLDDFDQVVVVDSHSTDRTREIAESFGADVVLFAWDGTYPKKKQWSLEQRVLKHRWVLLLDADEYPAQALIDELRSLAPRLGDMTDFGAYDLTLLYKFAGRFLKNGHRVTKRSLVDRYACKFPEIGDLEAPGIREVEGHYQPQTSKKVGRLDNPICHDDQDPLSSWFERHNRYSDWEAYLNQHRSLKHEIALKRSWKGRMFDRVPFKPLLFFLYAYVLRLGFRDGRPGFDYAFALASYYWQIGIKTRELRDRTRGA
ncbi:glycosyltransferase family 2 protein [Curtobacterium sp. MCBD17_040]|uniref:glycosyltransferase family 2 protein n=1 Tax=Curtobacterium sp. MCBD17_040 TaxID=2175674 RepID=UPI0021AC9909|nr:glycosyltransferase family 2 protein [Curtobacterium sp. MCBD17_040]WIB64148.1 glycosyltransferase family 2 protein [Curtobacterium sp. MCBD17_040]